MDESGNKGVVGMDDNQMPREPKPRCNAKKKSGISV